MMDTTATNKLAFRIAETLQHEWPNLNMEGWDLDAAAELIAMNLPVPWQEAAEEIERIESAINESRPQPLGPSLFSELRKAVHADEGMSMRTVMEAAIKKCQNAHRIRDLEADVAERDRAVADNAAFLSAVESRRASTGCPFCASIMVESSELVSGHRPSCIAIKGHPGTALLAEREAMKQRLAALERVAEAAKKRRDVWTRETLDDLDNALSELDETEKPITTEKGD